MLRTPRSSTYCRAAAILAVSLAVAGCGGGAAETGSSSVPQTVSQSPAVSADTNPTGSIQLSAANYSVAQGTGSVTVTVKRIGGSQNAVSIDYDTQDGTGLAGTDYVAASGTLDWAENDATDKSISIPVSSAVAFSGDKEFNIVLSNPSDGTLLGSPGSATVTISGSASASVGSLQFGADSYSTAQDAKSVTVTVNRNGGAVGDASVSYSTTDGTAAAGTDYTATTGELTWQDGDSAAKSFSVPISNAKSFSGSKAFDVTLSGATGGATIGTPGKAEVTIVGAASTSAGTLQLSASNYSVSQSGGTLQVTVNRVGGSSGAASVTHSTKNGSAVAGTDFTTTTGVLNWTDGDAAPKTFSIAISAASPFAGNRTFSVVLSNPSSGMAISNPGTATVTIAGSAAAPTGNLQLSSATYTVSQNAGSVTFTVSRAGGSNGATSAAYSTAGGTAVSGTDFTASSGTLQWANGDTASKSFSVAISNASPFSGSKSFAVSLSNPGNGASLGSPSKATATINGDASGAVGTVQLSASTYSTGQAAGTLKMTVNRSGGSNGAITVKYSTSDGTAAAGSDYTSTSGTLQWASADASAKTISIPISNSNPFSGSKTFTIALSSPTGGATAGSPTSAVATITGSASAPQSGSTFWVYRNGTFNWGGDYSYAATPNYKDTAGAPASGGYDIAVTVTSAYGGFQPYAGGTVPLWNFDDSQYTYLTFSLKPTVANQTAQLYFMKVGDIPVGIDVNPFNGKYGPAPQAGIWATYKIPLSDLGVKDTSVYKFAIQDQTGLGHNVFYIDNLGFE
jgi:Calx-beta domain